MTNLLPVTAVFGPGLVWAVYLSYCYWKTREGIINRIRREAWNEEHVEVCTCGAPFI